MAKMMKKFVEVSTTQLDREQRNMLSLAYKTVIAERRAVWRTLQSHVSKEDMNQMQLSVYEYYRARLIEEIRTICTEIFVYFAHFYYCLNSNSYYNQELVDNHLIPKSNEPEAKVFFFKIKGESISD